MSTGWSSTVMMQRLNTRVSQSSTTVCAINDREETTATAMASVMTSLLVTLVVFVQFVEFTFGGCVFGQYVFRCLFHFCVKGIVVYVNIVVLVVVIVCDFLTKYRQSYWWFKNVVFNRQIVLFSAESLTSPVLNTG